MSGNPWAGEVCLTIDGTPRRMKLTLGALAELEAALDTGSLIALVERFETGAFSARDLLLLLAAGLRGSGVDLSADALATAEIEGGPVAAARAAGRLLALAFGATERDAA
ncbi:MAG: gene transfer agent family protein [Rhodobacteraceae bacterium]|nr:gene transfer agent family protein [Paracoccaceae bacterium]